MNSAVAATHYCCKCEARFPQREPRCPQCRAWNTCKAGTPDTMSTDVMRLGDVESESAVKVATGFAELDACLDGGTVAGQVILLAGPPGSGKSTLALEIADAMTQVRRLDPESGKVGKKKNVCLLITSEEDIEKVRARSLRIGRGSEVLCCHAKQIGDVESDLASYQPQFAIVDSVNKLKGGHTPAGTVGLAQRLYEYAHATQTTLFITAHVNGEDEISGMIALQHTTDTVLQLDREQEGSPIRALRVRKNRHGSEEYVGLFEMRADGIHSYEPAKGLATSERHVGQAFAIAGVGGRMFPVEVQALTPAGRGSLHVLGYPVDRVRALLAVLSEHTDLPLGVVARDVYINVLGGISHRDAALDAAVAAAIASSVTGRPLEVPSCYAGEVDLLGRVNAPTAARVACAERHGFRLAQGGTLREMFGALEPALAKKGYGHDRSKERALGHPGSGRQRRARSGGQATRSRGAEHRERDP